MLVMVGTMNILDWVLDILEYYGVGPDSPHRDSSFVVVNESENSCNSLRLEFPPGV